MMSSDLEKDILKNTAIKDETNPSPVLLNYDDPKDYNNHTQPNASELSNFALSFSQMFTKPVDALKSSIMDNLAPKDSSYVPLQDPQVLAQGKDYMNANAEYFKDSPNASVTTDKIKYLRDQQWLNENLAQTPISTTLGSLAGGAASFYLMGPTIGALGAEGNIASRLVSNMAIGGAFTGAYGLTELQLNPEYSKDQVMKDTLMGAALGGVLTGLGEVPSLLRSRNDLIQELKTPTEASKIVTQEPSAEPIKEPTLFGENLDTGSLTDEEMSVNAHLQTSLSSLQDQYNTLHGSLFKNGGLESDKLISSINDILINKTQREQASSYTFNPEDTSFLPTFNEKPNFAKLSLLRDRYNSISTFENNTMTKMIDIRNQMDAINSKLKKPLANLGLKDIDYNPENSETDWDNFPLNSKSLSDTKSLLLSDSKYKDNPFVNDAQQYEEFKDSTVGAAQVGESFRGYDLTDNYKLDTSNPIAFAATKLGSIWSGSIDAGISKTPGIADAGARIFGTYGHIVGENNGIAAPFSMWETRGSLNLADMAHQKSIVDSVSDVYTKNGGTEDINSVMDSLTKKYIESDGIKPGNLQPHESVGFDEIQKFFGKKNSQLQSANLIEPHWKIKDEDGVERIINSDEYDKLSLNENNIIEPFVSKNSGYAPHNADVDKILANPKGATEALATGLQTKNPELVRAEAVKIADNYIKFFTTRDENDTRFMQTGVVKSANLKERSLDYDPKPFASYLKTDFASIIGDYSKSVNKDLSLKQNFDTTDMDSILGNLKGLYNDHATANPTKADSIMKEKESMIKQFRAELGRFTGKDKSVLNTYSFMSKGIETLKELQNDALMGHHGAWRALDVMQSKLTAAMYYTHGDAFSKLPEIYKNANLSKADMNFLHLAMESKMAGDASNIGGLNMDILKDKGTVSKVLDVKNTLINNLNLMSPMTDMGHHLNKATISQFILGAAKKVANRESDALTDFTNGKEFANEKPEFWEKELLRMGINKKDAVKICDEYEKNALSDPDKPGRTYLNLGAWKSDVQLKMATALKKEMDTQITTPTSGEKPAPYRTPMGGLFTQFQGYQMAIFQKRFVRTAQELWGQGGPASAIAFTRVAGSMVNAAMMVLAVDAISGKDISKIPPQELLAKAAQYGGLLPVLDTAGNILDRHGLGPSMFFNNQEKHFGDDKASDIVSGFLGPTVSTANDFYKAFQHTVTGQGSEKDLRLVLPHVPGWNMLYWNWLGNRLLYPDKSE